jgi:hypothetical protein
LIRKIVSIGQNSTRQDRTRQDKTIPERDRQIDNIFRLENKKYFGIFDSLYSGQKVISWFSE